MRKYIILLVLLGLCNIGAAPTRSYTYTTGTTISSSDVTTNEDNIYNYLQAGVDTISDGSIVNDDVNGSAAISSSKVNLTTIAQNVALSGTLTATGNSTFAGTTIADLGTVTTADINAGTWQGTVDGNWTAASQTCADLGTVTTAEFTAITDAGTITTADINGGTLDGVQVGGTTSTGEIIVNDSSDAADGLGSQGTSGQLLTSAGAGVNPTWSTVSHDYTLLTASANSGAATTGAITVAASKQYFVTFEFANEHATLANAVKLLIHGDTSADYQYTTVSVAEDGTVTGDGGSGATGFTLGTMGDTSDEGIIYGYGYISTYQNANSDTCANVVLHTMAKATTTTFDSFTLTGMKEEVLTVTNIEFTGTQNFTWRVNVYELSQS